jgi:3-vinyl bacteriochlorophyllide hydratase
MALALAAYVTYIINAGQFLWKLRLARLDHAEKLRSSAALGNGSSLTGSMS